MMTRLALWVLDPETARSLNELIAAVLNWLLRRI
jgi:hypothetical protein